MDEFESLLWLVSDERTAFSNHSLFRYSILVHVYTHTIWLLFVSFCYRYYVMIKSEPSKLAVKLLLIIIYIPSFVQMILLFFEYADPLVLLRIQEHLIPQYNLRGLMIFGAEDSTTFRSMFAIVHVAVMSTPIVICIFVLRKKIIKKLEFKGVDMHPNTRSLQLQLLRVSQHSFHIQLTRRSGPNLPIHNPILLPHRSRLLLRQPAWCLQRSILRVPRLLFFPLGPCPHSHFLVYFCNSVQKMAVENIACEAG